MLRYYSFPETSFYSDIMTKNINIRCPHCGTATTWHHNPTRPFCSERCRMIDLGRWDNEEYAVPGEKTETETETDNSDEESSV